MKTVLSAALLSVVVGGCGNGSGMPRPTDLPADVPNNAVIKRYANHPEGGLLEISWGHSSMLWAAPCRAAESAAEFARSAARVLQCPAELDMKIRPLYLGTLNVPMTRRARQRSFATTCCYSFRVLGNR